jgi:hypothetical protein
MVNFFPLGAACLFSFSLASALQLLPPNLKGIGKTKILNPIPIGSGTSVDLDKDSSSIKWMSTVQETAYLKPTKKKGLIQISVRKDKLSFIGGNDLECILLEGLDSAANVELDSSGGAFVSFKFPSLLSQHDAVMGRISPAAKLLAHSRIKRCDFNLTICKYTQFTN